MDDRTDSTERTPATNRRGVLRAGVAAALGATALGNVGAGPASGADPVILRRDFEDLPEGDWTVDESAWNGLNPWSVDATYVDVATVDGDTVLDTRYPAGQAGNGNGGVDMMVPFGRHYEELYHGYRVKFGAGFEFSNAGGKLPGLIGSADGVYAVTGGDDPNGENGWSARMMWRDPVDASPEAGGLAMFYVYHPDQPGEYGENMHWDDGPSGQVYFQRDTWHEVEHRIAMNTPGENDGVLEGWLDGEKAFERRDLRFRDVADLGINRFYFSSFFGGGNTQKWAHSREEHVYYDDFVVSTEPIWNGEGSQTETHTATATPTTTTTPGGPPAVGENDSRPTDPDGDGLYEDVNGNDRQDIADAVDLFRHRNSVDPQYFDFQEGNGVTIGDAVQLFRENTGGA